jgi:hypothetical protein
MHTPHNDTADSAAHTLSRAEHRTLDAIFHHPISHNLAWSDVVAVVERHGSVTQKANSEFLLTLGGETLAMRPPHGKQLATAELMQVRHFFTRAGWSPQQSAEAAAPAETAPPSLLVVVDHHGAKIYHVDTTAHDVAAHRIAPYDPHHFLHHLVHRNQDREQGQRAPEEAAYYEQIAATLATGGQITIVGHGTGKSNAAHHLVEYLQAHHTEIYHRVTRELVADLSSITPPQLLDLARAS